MAINGGVIRHLLSKLETGVHHLLFKLETGVHHTLPSLLLGETSAILFKLETGVCHQFFLNSKLVSVTSFFTRFS